MKYNDIRHTEHITSMVSVLSINNNKINVIFTGSPDGSQGFPSLPTGLHLRNVTVCFSCYPT